MCSSLSSVEILENITFVDSRAFNQCRKLKYIFYNGTSIPSYQSDAFLNTPASFIYATPKYQSDYFCGLPAWLFPTSAFSLSEIFTNSYHFSESNKFTSSNPFDASNTFTGSNLLSESDKFTKSYSFIASGEFTKSNLFSESNEFTISYLFDESNRFTKINLFSESNESTKSHLLSEIYFEHKSMTNTENTIFYSDYIKYSLTLSLTFVQRRSVSFSMSILISNSYYNSFDHNKGTFIFIITQSHYQLYLPYIIHYYSPIYVSTSLFFYITKRKGLTGEQLIGVTCGKCFHCIICHHHNLQKKEIY